MPDQHNPALAGQHTVDDEEIRISVVSHRQDVLWRVRNSAVLAKLFESSALCQSVSLAPQGRSRHDGDGSQRATAAAPLSSSYWNAGEVSG